MSFSRRIEEDAPLTNAKRDVALRLEQSKLGYTILRPSFFMEMSFNPLLGFDVANGKVVVYGSGENPISFVALRDVAAFAIAAMETDKTVRRCSRSTAPSP